MSDSGESTNSVLGPKGRIDTTSTASSEADNEKPAPELEDGSQERVNPSSIGPHADDASFNQDKISDEKHTADPDGADLEAGITGKETEAGSVPAGAAAAAAESEKDPNLVTWESPTDPANPKNWTYKRKWAVTIITSAYTFISAITSSIVSPTLPMISAEFNTTSNVAQQMMVSAFVLGYAIGPLFLGPLSELYGRVPVLQLSNAWYLVFNTACGGSHNTVEIILFRFLAGLGGSAPMSVSGGVLGDVWRPEERGKAMSIYTLMPLLGPALGPVIGSIVVQYSQWRWGFYAISIANAVVMTLGLLLMRETYPARILHVKCRQLRKATGNQALHTEQDRTGAAAAGTKLRTALMRPLRLLLTQPLVQALAVYMAYLYGMMYLVLSTLPRLWVARYHFSQIDSGLQYIAAGIGFFLGAQVCAPLMDGIYKRLKARNGGAGQPEFRAPPMVLGAVIVPIGLVIYGWSAQYLVFWVWPDIGLLLASFGMILCFQCIQAYNDDTYSRYPASANSAVAVLRAIAGFSFPLFAPDMYDVLGYGWGNSLLAFLGVVLGWPAPVLMWTYGAKLRAKSTYAAGP